MQALIGGTSGGPVIELQSASFAVVPAWTWVDVTNVSPAPQPGWMATLANGAWSFAAPAMAPPPSLAQQAQAALSAGFTVTSTATPALDGTYGCDAAAQQELAYVMIYINRNAKFPGSASTYAYPDLAGLPHVFPSTDAFAALATAIADYVSDVLAVARNGAGSFPANTATIA